MKMTPTLRKRILRHAKIKKPGQTQFLCFVLTRTKKLARLLGRPIILRHWWQPCRQCSRLDLVCVYVLPDGRLERHTFHGGMQ